ncbi:MAG: hypothetical protein M1536_04800 [Firmicutes bacterium]|nr:hypothetical protein [Bacillota bacterium]
MEKIFGKAIIITLVVTTLGLVIWMNSYVKAVDIKEDNPVAMVASVSGDCRILIPSRTERRAYVLDFLKPGYQIRTGSDGEAVIIFFYNGHTETISSNTSCTAAFKTLTQETKPVARKGVNDINTELYEIPYILGVALSQQSLASADNPGEKEKEDMFLQAWVKTTTFPPVFKWANAGKSEYRFQLFNEWNEFLYEKAVSATSFKFPYKAPLQLTKGGLYYWQVLTHDNEQIVGKYPFKVTTAFQAKTISRYEKELDKSKKENLKNTVPYVKLFLLYNQFRSWDKLLHLCEDLRDIDPQNPIVYRMLARLYMLKDCPYYAKDALNKAVSLGAVEEVITTPSPAASPASTASPAPTETGSPNQY